MTLIYKALTMFNNKIFMFGDPNQCEPVESNSQRRYNFLESKTANERERILNTLKVVVDMI